MRVEVRERSEDRHGEVFEISEHAELRASERSLGIEAIRMALRFGRRVYTRGAAIYALGRKEVARYAKAGYDLARFEGVQVVTVDGTVVTAYRNSDFRSLQRHGRASWRDGR